MTRPDHDTNAGPPNPPPRIPDHELIRRIGRGAYGEVWLARSVTGAFRAVKIVYRSSFDRDRPFQREFEGIQKFEPISRRHESQVDILHVGRNGDYFYYVMELADDQASGGQILADHYAPRTLKSDLAFRTRLPFEEAVAIGISLTTALQHLHENGLVHRDVKPSNIIFVNGVAKLADIGLVTGVDATRSYVGTEGFAAPEGPGTPQADLYSLGKVLYEACTGRDRQEFPELPTELREFPDREGLMELNAVIARACRHDPKDRYASAAQMRADLELLQSGKSLARLHRTERQLRLVRRTGALVTALAVVIAGGWWWQARQTMAVRKLAIEKSLLAENNAKLVEENRQRIVRRDISEGTRLLDESDPAGALLWFAEALSSLTNDPAAESVHRIRIQQTLKELPRLLHLLPHEHGVLVGAFSEDGRRVVTGTEWGYLCVWDSQSGRPLWKPQALGVYSIAQARFTRDGRRVFGSSVLPWGFSQESFPTNFAAIFDTETGKPLHLLSATNLVRVDLSPDDRWLVTADTDHRIRLHDAGDGRTIAEFRGHTDRIRQFVFSTNSQVLASSSDDQTVRLWRLPSGEPIREPVPWKNGPIALSPDGHLLALASRSADADTNSFVETWTVEERERVGPQINMPGAIGALSFVGREAQALFVMTDRECALFDPQTHRQLLRTIKTPPGQHVFSVCPDSRRMIFGGPQGLEGMWSFETGERLMQGCLRSQSLAEASFSPDGSQILLMGENGTAALFSSIQLFEDAAFRLESEVLSGDSVTFLKFNYRFSPDRRYFLNIYGDGRHSIVDFARMTELGITPHRNGMRAIQGILDATGRQGAIWYSGLDTNIVELWSERGDTTNYFTLPHPCGLWERMQFSPDGEQLLTPGNDGQVRIWTTSDGALKRSVSVPSISGPWLLPDGDTAFGVSSVTGKFAFFNLATGASGGMNLPPMLLDTFCYNLQGDRFATVGSVGWTRIWDARTFEPLSPQLQHGGAVSWVDWNVEGDRLITAGITPEVRVWQAATGDQILAPLRLGSLPLKTALWSQDGRFIVARSDENVVRVWDSATGEPVTPILRHNGYVRLAHLAVSNRLVTLTLPDRIRAWNLEESALSADHLSKYAQLMSGRRLNAAGAMLPLKPAELLDLLRSVRVSLPELFTSSTEELREWHRRQVPAPNTLARLEVGLFHLDRLAELDPADPWVNEQRTRFRKLQLPQRAAGTPPNLVDLSDFFTHSLDLLPNQEFADLPRGIQRLGGTTFDLRGILLLDRTASPSPGDASRPIRGCGIPVRRVCRQLHFLHAVGGNEGKDGEQVARWLIHYADGNSEVWPVIYGKQVRDWWWWAKDPQKVSEAVIAWEGHSPIPLAQGAENVRVFQATWKNPRPDIEVIHLDFIRGQTKVDPFVLAITAE
jgi:WD40 repeat protein